MRAQLDEQRDATDVAAFVGEAVLLPATVHNGQADCVLGSCPDGDVRLMIHPEQLTIHTNNGAVGVPARVHEISYFGHDASVRLALLPDGPSVTARVHGHHLPPVDSDVHLTLDGPAITYPAG